MIWSEEVEIEKSVVMNKISEELTSKSYVDGLISTTIKLDSVNTFTANQNISGAQNLRCILKIQTIVQG
jgi:hypothetical protein